MNLLLLVLGILNGLNTPTKVREFRAAVVLWQGDLLGHLAHGNVKLLAQAEVVVPNEKSGRVQCGRPAPRATVDVCVVTHPGGRLWLDVTTALPGAKREARSTAVVLPGERVRLRVAADSSESQTWLEVAVTEEVKVK